MKSLRILFIAGREPGYMRNAMILKSLYHDDSLDVVECTSSANSYIKRYIHVLLKFLFLKNKHFDLIFIGYLGQPLVPIFRLLLNKPIIFDAFLSIYDTLCFDRKNFRANSIQGKVSYWLDKYSCKISDVVILDTYAHIDYFTKTFRLNKVHFERIYVGADEFVFHPIDVQIDSHKFKVLYYSTYHPLHGLEYIIKAAKILEVHDDIEFIIIGRGIEYDRIQKLSKDLNIKNVEFIGWISPSKFYNTVRYYIAESDICLGGHFSAIEKGQRVIAEKTFEFIAMKKPVIVGDNSANRELFRDRESAILVGHANPQALADAILELRNDRSLREKIAEEGFRIFAQNCTYISIGSNIHEIINKLASAPQH